MSSLIKQAMAARALKLVSRNLICRVESALIDEPASLASRHNRLIISLMVRNDAAIFLKGVSFRRNIRVLSLGFSKWRVGRMSCGA
jgi:hypothetical protein